MRHAPAIFGPAGQDRRVAGTGTSEPARRNSLLHIAGIFVALLGPVAAILASAIGRYLLEKGPPFIRKHGGVVFPWIAPITVIVAIILAVKIGVIDSNQSGDAAANDLSAAHATSASADMDAQVAFLTGRATERATFATAQATQGLVVVTVGVIAATIAGLIGTVGIRKDSALPEPQN